MSEIVDSPFFKLLKVFVVVSGVAIILGTVTLIWLLATRGESEPDPGTAAQRVVAAEGIPLPPGAEVSQATLSGSRLVLLGRIPGEGQFVAVVDVGRGELVRLLRLRHGQP
jgi:hypothetical protein